MIEAGSLPSVVMGGFLKGVPPGDLEKCGCKHDVRLRQIHTQSSLINVYFRL